MLLTLIGLEVSACKENAMIIILNSLRQVVEHV